MLRPSMMLRAVCSAAILASSPFILALPQAAQQQTAPASVVRPVGTISQIKGSAITLKADNGTEVNILVQDSARLLRTAPGQQDLKDATKITLQDLQVGDRILVRGQVGDDGKSVLAASVIAIKKTDIAEKHQRDLQDWQRRGIGGLVKAVDPSAGTATISVMGATGSTSVTVKTTKDTSVRRYAPDSVRFDDAKPGTLADIKVGDQLRARGAKNADNTELVAEEIVSGNFRNIAGLITSVDASKNTITVNDLATKKPVTVHIANDSEMHMLPQMIAAGLARRLKGGAGGDANGEPPAAPEARMQGQGPGEAQGGAAPGGPRRAGGDLGQMMSRLPALKFDELTKGSAVMIVTTAGSTTTDATAITLLTGVEPILTASPNGSGAASLLTPWSLSTSGGAGGDSIAQ